MSTHNICFEQKYKKYQNFLSENFHISVIKFSVYLNSHVFVMYNNFFLPASPASYTHIFSQGFTNII